MNKKLRYYENEKKVGVEGGWGGGGGVSVDVNEEFQKNIEKYVFQNFTKYFSHHPLSADTSFKFLSLILFEIWHLQNFILLFSKDRNFTRGNN